VIDILIPCKGFAAGKSRLAPVLAPDARAWLCETLLSRTLAAALAFTGRGGRVAVVSPERAALDLASALGAIAIEDLGRGLNPSLAEGSARLAGDGAIIILPIDLPSLVPSALEALVANEREVVIAADLAGTGTNALGLGRAVRAHFPFAFGEGSHAAHVAVARHREFAVRTVSDPRLGFDLDTPADLLRLSARELAP
jgi:2-phospho-L-lactate guanylyltransferase